MRTTGRGFSRSELPEEQCTSAENLSLIKELRGSFSYDVGGGSQRSRVALNILKLADFRRIP